MKSTVRSTVTSTVTSLVPSDMKSTVRSAARYLRRPVPLAISAVAATVMLACVVLAAFVWLTGFVPGTHLMRFQGPAMRPTIRDGQLIQVRDYGGANPARGDIVIFHRPAGFPGADGIPGCLRVIAIPGDSIALTATGVVLNGKPLAEPYVAPENADNSVILHALTLEVGQYYVMGDNRGDSADSRYFGPIGRASIVGKVVAIRG